MSVLNLARSVVAELDRRVSHGTVPSSVPWDSGRQRAAEGVNGTDGTHGADGTFGAIGLETKRDAPPCPAAAADEQRAEISNALDRLPVECTRDGTRLLRATRHFIASQWFDVAVRNGWTLSELFGVDNFAPQDEAVWGLVVGLALVPGKFDEIISLDGEAAVILCRIHFGRRRRIERRFTPPADAVVWWECWGLVACAIA